MTRQLDSKTQGVDEVIVYTVNIANVGSNPTSVSVDVFLSSNLATSVKATVMPTGSPSVVGTVITLPPLKLLTVGNTYRIEVKYTVSGNIVENYFLVTAES
jgi:hypothetical protein